MGFSLKAALAGAIQGGAHAVGEVADFQIKEQSRLREREEMRAQRMEEMRYQDELLANRERRVDELKTARENKAREARGGVLRDTLASLRESGVNSGSVQGRMALANAFEAAGYIEEAGKYVDDANKLRQLDDSKAIREQQLRMHNESIRESRLYRNDQKEREADENVRKTVRAYSKGFSEPDPNDSSKTVKIEDMTGAFEGAYDHLRDQGLSAETSRKEIANMQKAIALDIEKNKTPPRQAIMRAVTTLTTGKDPFAPVEERPAGAPAATGKTDKYIPPAFGGGSSPEETKPAQVKPDWRNSTMDTGVGNFVRSDNKAGIFRKWFDEN